MGTTAEDAMTIDRDTLKQRLEQANEVLGGTLLAFMRSGAAARATVELKAAAGNYLHAAEQRITDLEAQVAALTAQVPQWQSIETAPKDGSGVLFRTVGGRSLVLRWCPCDEYPDTWTDGEYHWSALKLTHWMPLPSPPRGEDGNGTT